MTVQEAIEKLKYMPVEIFDDKAFEAKEMGIQALQELEQYKSLGTVEELKEAREKQIPKKPKIIKHKHYNSHTCPFCDLELICSDETGYFSGKQHKYCPNCGQALKWGD